MIIGLPVIVVAQAAPTAAPSAAPAASDAAVAARARDWLHQIQTGKVDRSQLDAKMNAALTDALVSQVSAQLAPLGDPKAFTLVQKTSQESFTVYVYKVEFANITIFETLALDADGKVAGLTFRPSQ